MTNTSQMYFNKFSSGTILALLALSGMLFLVPMAAPVHATNASLPTITVGQLGFNPVLADSDYPLSVTITNPSTNQYAITAFTVSVPNSNWDIAYCYNGNVFIDCSVTPTGSSALYSADTAGGYPGLAPGTSDVVYFGVYSPLGSASNAYPFTGTFTTTIQDQSNNAYYVGPKFGLQVIADTSYLAVTVTPGGSNTATSYTAGTAAYTVSAQLTCTTSEPGCTTGYENGVTISWLQSGYSVDAVYSFGSTSQVTAGTGTNAGTVSTTFQPSNVAGYSTGVVAYTGTFSPEGLHSPYWMDDGGYNCYVEDGYNYCPEYGYICEFELGCPMSADITTIPGAPASVGFTSGGNAFNSGSTIYLNTQGTTTNTTHYTGAQLCNTVNSGCTSDSQQVAVSVTDKFGNSLQFSSLTSPEITFQTASGAKFDATGLPSIISNYVPTSTPQPVPDNYYQSSTYGSAGVITATITGTYNGSPFSVSGSSGSIVTSTFATNGTFATTDHTPLLDNTVQAGKSLTFEVVLGVAQKNVPITVAICGYELCDSLTTQGYSGSITTATGVTNSSGEYSTSLVVDTVAHSVAELNATVSDPVTGTPTNTFGILQDNTTTTIAGPPAKYTVFVGVGSDLIPGISESFPGQTVYVNVAVTDAYGNPVYVPGSEEVQISLTANPATLSDPQPDIPANCYWTNGTSGNGCTAPYNSFGPVSWTLSSTVGSIDTISATGVLNGVSITSATVSVTIVSKLPTLSVTTPVPLAGVIYSDSINAQFRGWANVSAGYNGLATMSSLGWKIGTASWQTTSLPGVEDATWSVVATLPVGLSSIQFNATDSKGNVVVGSPYQVLVDTEAPVVTNTTPNNATLNPGQFFQAKIVVDEGDLNATSVQVSVNGTAIASADVQIAGTNDLGTSVTYTVTALLPTGDNNVAVTASSLAGLTGSSNSEVVHVTVAQSGSIVFTQSEAVYGQVGAYSGVTVPVTNLWSTSQNVVVFATFKSGTSTYIAEGTTTLAPGQTINVFLIGIQNIPAGTYTITFAAVTTSNVPVSAPTTPITLVVT